MDHDSRHRSLRIALRWVAVSACGAAMAGVGQAQMEPVAGKMVVGFYPGVNATTAKAILQQHGATVQRTIPNLGTYIVRIPEHANAQAIAQSMAHRPQVRFAEPEYRSRPDLIPNDPLFASSWHLNKIAAPVAWNTTTGASNVVIAILDTGCDPTHPDLVNKYVPGWNTFDNNSNTSDVYGHGTAVAGTAGAQGNNGLGVAAVAFGCKIMPMRISDTAGWGYTSTVSAALTWAADHGARVANISYAFSTSSAVASAAQYFMSRGGVVTVSAGNDGVFSTAADNLHVLTISATDSADAMASWSNTGNNVDLAAPGTGIYTTSRGGGYGAWTGTSFSAPIVAGVAGLVITANPLLTGAQVVDLLKQGADDRGAAGWDASFGWGRVNASNSVAMAAGPPPPDTTPPSVSFAAPTQGAAVSGSTSVNISATDNVGVANVELFLNGTSVGVDTSAPYSFAWNTAGVANGTYALRAVARDAANNETAAEISVSVSNDVLAPTVTIVAPGGGASFTNSLAVSSSASDNVGVVKVEIWANGSLKATDTAAPWSFSLNTRKWARGNHSLTCKAYDARGNVGVSGAVTVTKN